MVRRHLGSVLVLLGLLCWLTPLVLHASHNLVPPVVPALPPPPPKSTTAPSDVFTASTDETAHLIGKVTIPSLTLSVPLFDSPSAEALQQGAVLVPGSSYPAGKSGEHTVIAAHNGLLDRTLFAHLDRLQLAATFSVTVGATTRYYRVIDKQVLTPEAASRIDLTTEQELVTLVTCTPFMQNTHRLLVTGKRIATTEKLKATTLATSKRQSTLALITLIFVAIVCLAGVLLWWHLHHRFLK